MDSNEFNKFAGAGLGALLAFLLLGFFADKVFETEKPHGDEPTLAFALEIESEEEAVEEEPAEIDLAALAVKADTAAGAKVFNQCKACHKVEDGANGVGPHLHNVVGRAIAAVDSYNYSNALMAKDGVWDLAALSGFLEKPSAWAPGTKMGYAGLRDPQDRVDVIAWLNEQGESPIELAAASVEPEPVEEASATEAETAEAAPSAEAETAAEAAPEATETAEAEAAPAAEETVAPETEAVEGTEDAAMSEIAAAAPSAETETDEATAEAEVTENEAAEAASEADVAPEVEAPVETAEAEAAPEVETAGAEAALEAEATEAEVAEAEVAEAETAAEAASTDAAPAAAEAVEEDSMEVAMAPAPTAEAAPATGLAAKIANASADAGERVFRKCRACHVVEDGKNRVGPHLWGVVNREIASVDGFNYSNAMASMEGAWTFEELNGYLEAPRQWVPGTKMAFAGLKDEEDRINVIVYLNEADGTPEKLVSAGPAVIPASAEPATETAEAAPEATPALDAAAEPVAAEEAMNVAAATPAADAEPAAATGLYADLLAAASAANGEKVFRQCRACHVVEEGKNRVGPHLNNVVGRSIAGVDGFRYSNALQGLDGAWTLEELMAWLENPRGYAPGNKMVYAGLRDAQDRIDVLTYINAESSDPQPLQ